MNGLKQLRQWFMGLQKRERLILGGGGLILALFILYAGLLNPYISHRHALRVQISQLQSLLAWMRPAADKLETIHGPQYGNLPGGSLLSAVNNSVTSAGLGNSLQQAQQASDGSVRAQFSNADFDSLVRWLNTLNKNYGVVAAEVSVTKGSSPGLVNVNLKLQMQGSNQ
ncbi:MAG: type II secretion system protein M [Gammaproteobacteria bacterium]|nr:type II secretion system protein M [Gammaproteobacteria bacterium]MDE2346080.1 type II secretion system protein M [Gammaproteobacteria bacterium]